mmetsp:Transcript_17205/g.22373  ORF Transcript_17205/g.22373 Transcript_17205/m.22373 type:complete len:527 (-) Transcript_17205:77-1657(-)|eukprot:CAMPEP_0117790886 /NCGR_PEP_ID=MMETSP0948-20121206/8535_1 /TAXON_ID=44440 /ORGANISM="Chattonella subsalsa, Strain CCMP2191" /LENGTH=526 /DNA_ID=CAMNT_0005620847 /DNA_START=500 /DNA_END=2080 /DNA_ORIENTATION=-
MNVIGLPQPYFMHSQEIQAAIEWETERTEILENPSYQNYQLDCLNPEQLEIANEIIKLLEQNNRQQMKVIFVTGAGGCGKTRLHNSLIMQALRQNKIIATAAWSGIAATLLIKGQTVHKTFHLPLHFEGGQTIHISPSSASGRFLKSVDLFIIDEASMIPLKAWQKIDTLFKDLNNNNIAMGGQLFVISGHFAQILPIIKHGTRPHIINNCLTSWEEWKHVPIKNLTKNMRTEPGAGDFAAWLLQLESGSTNTTSDTNNPNNVILPVDLCVKKGELIGEIFRHMTEHTVASYHNNVILTPWNDSANEINQVILQNHFQSTEKTYYSKDEAILPEENPEHPADTLYPQEFLHSMTPSGMPPHELQLKQGAIVIILRTLNMKQHLCNGRRMIVEHMTQNGLKLKHIGDLEGQPSVWVPRIIFKSEPLPFVLVRRQFPVKLAFCMTIDKSQGNTFNKVGVFLPRPVFSHGQFYVACSRTKSFKRLKFEILHDAEGIPLPDDYDHVNNPPLNITRNIVYEEIFKRVNKQE